MTKHLRTSSPACTHLLVYPVLVYGPDGGYVGGEQLREGEAGVAGPGADEAGLAHRRVAHHHAFDVLLVWLLIVHAPMSPRPPAADSGTGGLGTWDERTQVNTTL